MKLNYFQNGRTGVEYPLEFGAAPSPSPSPSSRAAVHVILLHSMSPPRPVVYRSNRSAVFHLSKYNNYFPMVELLVVSSGGSCRRSNLTKALFSSEKISDFATVALSFLFDKYCPIMN